jgi:hypothetical protein
MNKSVSSRNQAHVTDEGLMYVNSQCAAADADDMKRR